MVRLPQGERPLALNRTFQVSLLTNGHSSCFDLLRNGTPASFRLFPVGSYVVVPGAGSFLPTLFGLLKAIC